MMISPSDKDEVSRASGERPSSSRAVVDAEENLFVSVGFTPSHLTTFWKY